MQFAERLGDDHRSLSNMRLVCRRWRDAVNSARISLQPKGFGGYAGIFRRPIRLDFSSRHFSPVMQRQDLESFEQSMRGVEKCILDNIQHVTSLSTLLHADRLLELSLENSNVTDAILLRILPKFKSLQTLNVQGCMFLRGEWLDMLQHMSLLEVLKVGGCGMDLTQYKDWNKIFRSLSRLRTIVLMGNILSDDCIKALGHCPDLMYVDIRKCSDVTYESLYALSTLCPGIQTLKIGPLFHCSLDELWQMIPRFKSLRALEIYGHMERPFRSLADVLDRDLWHMPPLEKLSLMDSYYDWSTVKALSIACGQSLEYLHIGHSRPGDIVRCCSRDAIEDTDVTFPKLKHLKGVYSILPLNAMIALISSCPRLETLDLSGYHHLKPTRAMRRMVTLDHRTGDTQKQNSRTHLIDVFSRVLGSLLHLKRLKLQNTCVEDAHLTHLSNLSLVEKIDLSNNIGVTDVTLAQIVSWKNLSTLDILNTSVSSDGIEFLRGNLASKLEEFYVSGNLHGVSGLDVYRFVSNFPQMRILHMKDLKRVEDEILAKVAEKCPHITDLSLAGCQGISPNGLPCIVNLKNLVKLDISRLRTTVSDQNLRIILSNTCLSELRVSGAELSQCSLEALLASKMLHYIDISFCFGIGNDDHCATIIQKSGSPVKIRLPQGTTRLGLYRPEGSSHARRSLAF